MLINTKIAFPAAIVIGTAVSTMNRSISTSRRYRLSRWSRVKCHFAEWRRPGPSPVPQNFGWPGPHNSVARLFGARTVPRNAVVPTSSELVERHRERETWRYVAVALDEAARGGDIKDVLIALRIVLQLEQVPCL